MSLEDFQFLVAATKQGSPHWVTSVLEPTLMRRSLFFAETALGKTLPSDVVLEMTSIVEADTMFVSLVELVVSQATHSPQAYVELQEKPGMKSFSTDRQELFLELAAAPMFFANMKYGDSYGDFRLVHSDIERVREGSERLDRARAMNLGCEWPLRPRTFISQASIRKAAKVHPFVSRLKNARQRRKNKLARSAAANAEAAADA